MDASVCRSCHLPKASLTCALCENPVCKKCVQDLPKDSFAFLEPLPPHLSHRKYCGACYDDKVASDLREYESTVRRAKAVFVFWKTKSEETRLMKRTEKALTAECDDEEETLLRLAYQAAKRGFNALIDAEVKGTKVRNEGYQTTRWHGRGIPTHVDAEKLNRQDKKR